MNRSRRLDAPMVAPAPATSLKDATNDVLRDDLIKAGQHQLALKLETYRQLEQGGMFNAVVSGEEYTHFVSQVTLLAENGLIRGAHDRVTAAKVKLGLTNN